MGKHSPLFRMVAALLIAFTWSGGVGAGRVEGCKKGREPGDKWFDGCQWCVCTARGRHCSSSTCSGLVDHVPACHVTGQRWTDGCYRCRCRRHGITCRLDVTCASLRQQPLPCLADERCVCGPDGVPSCTAEVMDRNAFTARRVHLGFSREGLGHFSRGALRSQRGLVASSRRRLQSLVARAGHHRLGQEERSSVTARSAPSSQSELLIMSDNLCQFGARWYGGSLRCYCDLGGAIACGNPVFVLAFFDDVRVENHPCEEGHTWEDGCRVCTCPVNGVIFCRHSQKCRKRAALQGENDSSNRFAEGISDVGELDEEGSLSVASALGPALQKKAGCLPGSVWTTRCWQCRCTRHAHQVCRPRPCAAHDITPPTTQGIDHQALKPPASNNQARGGSTSLGPPPFKRFRGPMMVVPTPAGLFQPPAYALWSVRPPNIQQCGRFRVGEKFWHECNLCLCTRRGPRCQGKLCR